MVADEILAQRTYRNARAALLPGKRLPLNVFKDRWDDFFFCESDSIFEPAFISAMNIFLDAEDAQVCCLVNLGNSEVAETNNPPFRCLDRSITPEHYISLLRGNGPPDAWLFLVDRYVCLSDQGRWCVYCEKENDIAVIAVRSRNDTKKFAAALEKLEASSIEQAYQAYKEGKFRFEKLTAFWLATLVDQYSPFLHK